MNPPLYIALTANDLAKAYQPSYKPPAGGRSIELPKDTGPGPAAPTPKSDPTVTPSVRGSGQIPGQQYAGTSTRQVLSPEHLSARHALNVEYHSRPAQGGVGGPGHTNAVKDQKAFKERNPGVTHSLTHMREVAQSHPHLAEGISRSVEDQPRLYIGGKR